jgi:hypothetical protein
MIRRPRIRGRVRAYASRASCVCVCVCVCVACVSHVRVFRAMIVNVCVSVGLGVRACRGCRMRELQRELARRCRAGRRMRGMQSTRAAVVVRIRADRALQHGRWEEMMCNNAGATHSARTEHDDRPDGRRRAETRALATNRYLEGAHRSARICRAANGLRSRSSSVLEKIAALFPVSSARPERGRPFRRRQSERDTIRV